MNAASGAPGAIAGATAPAAGRVFVLHQRELGPGRYRYDLLWEHGLRSAALGRDRVAGLQPFRRYACRTQQAHAVEHLPTLIEARDEASFEPRGRGLIAGLYLNEILVRCLPGQAWLERLAGRYATWLRGLDDPEALPWCLRLAEYALFRELGLGVDTLAGDVAGVAETNGSEAQWRFVLGAGWSMVTDARAAAIPGAIPGAQLHRWQALADAFERRWDERGSSTSPPFGVPSTSSPVPNLAAHDVQEPASDADSMAVLRDFVDLVLVAEAENPGFARAVRDLHRNVIDQFLDGREPLRSRALWQHASAFDDSANSSQSRKQGTP